MDKPVANDRPAEVYAVEIGGQVASQHASFTAALKAGLALKGRNAGAEVKVYEAGERRQPSAAA